MNTLDLGALKIGLVTDLAKGISEIKKVGDTTEETQNKSKKNFSAIGKSVGIMGAAIGGACVAAGAALIKMTNDMADYSDDILTFSAKTGIATDSVQKLYYMQESADVSMQSWQKAIAKTTTAVKQYQQGNTETVKAVDALGVSFTDAGGKMKSQYDIMFDMLGALENVGDSTQRDVLANQIFGRSYQDLLPVMEMGVDNFKAQADEAEKLGLVVEEDVLTSFNDYKDTMDKIKQQLAKALLPVLQAFLPLLQSLAEAFSEWLGSSETKAAIQSIANTLSDFVTQNKQAIADFVKGALEALLGIFKWIINNKEAVLIALAGITAAVIAFNVAASANPIGAIILAVTALLALLTSLPTEMDGINAKVREANAATAAWRSEMDNLDTSINSFSDMTNSAGQTLGDLAGIISDNQNKINEIYKTAFDENRSLRDDEIQSVQEYLDNIAAAQEEQYQLYQAQLGAQVTLLQEQLKNENLTYEQRKQIMGQLETAQAQYTESVNGSIQNELAALTMRLQRGEITQEQYSQMTQSALDRQKEYAAQGSAITQGIVDENISAMEKQSQVNMQAYNNRTTHTKSMETVQQHYAQRMKEINNDETLSWFDKTALLQEAERQAIADFAKLAADQEVTWDNYQFLTDSNIQQQTAKFFDWIGTNKAQGGQLSEDSRQNARDILNAYASLPEDLQESGLNSLRGLAQGMADEFPGLKDAASMDMDQLIQAMNDALGVASPSWKMDSAGQNMMEGLKQGTNKKAPSLMDHIRNIGQSMIDGFKNLFQIKSPSRVFRGFGENIGAGLEEGLLSSTDAVMKAGDELSKAALDGLNANKLEMEAVAFAGDALADAYRTPDISGYINTHEGSKDASGSVIKNEQNNYFTARELTPYEQAQQTRRLGKALFEGV